MPSLKQDKLADGVDKSHDAWVAASPYWNNDDREMSRATQILQLAEGKNQLKRKDAWKKGVGEVIPAKKKTKKDDDKEDKFVYKADMPGAGKDNQMKKKGKFNPDQFKRGGAQKRAWEV